MTARVQASSDAQLSAGVSGQRVAVVGVTGSGKTTLAARLARHMNVPHVEFDALYWGPDWTPAPPELFRTRVTEALAGQAWVTDGNYGQVRDLVWGSATTLVWLNYSLPLILWRLTLRSCRRIADRAVLWNNNREQLRQILFSRDSLYLWALHSYRRQRREYPELLRQPRFAHLTVVRLPSPEAAEHFMQQQLRKKQKSGAAS